MGEGRGDVLHYRRRRLPTFSPTGTHWHTHTQRFFYRRQHLVSFFLKGFHLVDFKMKAGYIFINPALSKNQKISISTIRSKIKFKHSKQQIHYPHTFSILLQQYFAPRHILSVRSFGSQGSDLWHLMEPQFLQNPRHHTAASESGVLLCVQ